MNGTIQRNKMDEQRGRQNLVWDKLQRGQYVNEDYYAVDFSQRPPRKFVHTDGIRVYEGGLIEVDPPVARNPGLRDYLWGTFGLNFELVNSCPGIEFSLERQAHPQVDHSYRNRLA